MRINCPNCSKLFNVNDDQIPSSGRLLQCGSCNHKWFFKSEVKIDQNIIKKKEQKNEKSARYEKKIDKKEIIIDNELKNKKSTKENISPAEDKKKTNYFKILLVSLITFAAIIILLDTFKSKISIFFPQINIVLESLYETLKDIYFFLIDLFK